MVIRAASLSTESTRRTMAWAFWIAVGLALVQVSAVTREDVVLFRSIAELLMDGGVPYGEVTIEHLPVSVIPMVGAWLLGGFTSVSVFVIVYGSMMVGLLAWSGGLLEGIGRRIDVTLDPMEWIMMVGPILPLVMFRTDPVAVLCFLGSVALILQGRRSGAGAVLLAGVSAKAWPLVAVLEGWARGWRRWSIAMTGIGLTALAVIAALPGFRSGRAFDGIHTETIGGSLLGLTRTVRGLPVGRIQSAGAQYLDASILLMAVQAAAFGVIALLLVVRLGGGDARDRLVGLGAVTLAATLAIPLFSSQFVLWAMPMLVFHQSRVVRRLLSVAGAISLAQVIAWDWLLADSPAWYLMVAARNLVLLYILARLVRFPVTAPR